MTEINLGEYKLRFDPNEVRISIDGDRIDVGARRMEEEEEEEEDSGTELKSEDVFYRFESVDGNEFSDYIQFLQDETAYKDNKTGEINLGQYFKEKYIIEKDKLW